MVSGGGRVTLPPPLKNQRNRLKVAITDIATVQIGYQFRERIEPVSDGTHSVIQIRDFDDNYILNPSKLVRVKIDKLSENYIVNKGDVLFLSRGHKNWAAPILEALEDTIAVSHFFIIKLHNEKVLPEYLAWYINQPPAQQFLYSLAKRGSHMPIIAKGAFEGLTIEIPSIITQRKIVEISRLMKKEDQLLGDIQKKRTQLINSICLQASKTE
ncbi:MAG TPA: hypothetical protein DHW81_06735 [Nitrospiraceae bacterium]|nr:hypothetical protein [Nitrospiraceae bacterium]